jgi:hypothetical protein
VRNVRRPVPPDPTMGVCLVLRHRYLKDSYASTDARSENIRRVESALVAGLDDRYATATEPALYELRALTLPVMELEIAFRGGT